MEPDDVAPTLVEVLQAMGDPHRLAMLRTLSDGAWHPCGSGEWVAVLHKSTVSHHLRILREVGLLEDQQRGRSKYGRLRRDVVDARFPGLLDGVLASIEADGACS